MSYYGSSKYSSSEEGEYQLELIEHELERNDEGFVNVYTECVCPGDGTEYAKAAIGVWFMDNHELNVSRRLYENPCYNRAAFKSITIACRQARKANVRKLKINLTSAFLKNCIETLIPKWRSNGWKNSIGETLAQKQEILEMQDALDEFEKIDWIFHNNYKFDGMNGALNLAKNAADSESD
ncbi:ribonuclease H1-like [Leptopilina heterotoma]|uniref:ribonuclease H1-like n=1 Tax=Leptopilina heterotoma TaxID=63436 RepID=UPI001CA979C7|nr:ribonuclease H1-like [Leptopilina heterotoma]XP_043465908.1 ribonuclease H1-like [Leptopilina heterotoma]